jgi:hypothetical protein
MRQKGMVPVAIDCRMEDTSRIERPIYWVKIKYAPDTKREKWRWAVGEADELQVHANDAAREGLKLVKRTRIADTKTGRPASCAIWRGPRR